MKNLKQILDGVKINRIINEDNAKEIQGIAFDSRKVEEGYVFVAEKGELADGHSYICSAVQSGAKVIVLDNASYMPESNDNTSVTYILTDDSSLALSQIACNFYDRPTEKLKLVGITGTNGKTTTVTLLYELFTALGYKCGKISTVENIVAGKVLPTQRTTPDSITLNRLFSDMVQQDCTYVFMEVSSHAIVQNRIGGLHFAGGIFSNITLDHLDYHKTFLAYIQAKKAFFDRLDKDAFALVNADDKNGLVMVQNTKAKVYTYGLSGAGYDYRTKIIESSFEGSDLLIDGKEVFVPMVGRFNAYNILAVYATAMLLGADKQQVLTDISLLKAAKGRFEIYKLKSGAYAVIDYAHTPDAVENVLKTINDCKTQVSQKVYTVIGCGGDRDKSKRPLMAKISQQLSDVLILTSDNPRSEKPEDIIKDMQQGLVNTSDTKTFTVADRAEAIKLACTMAEKDDIVLVAGKGHENYQEIYGEKHHFDDKEEVLRYM
ncbi:MAG: UDP-N-acetylmuramoyl-L-alanyl-D-glutamate--2,6-diaminopimelate ligase [Bacteroidales bacterium]|nr:UDP-N-acetylmuramoyl-L-alanyl-D-glutamate--2,6-diaminopimelate ligase [Bacteroidales bacterium]